MSTENLTEEQRYEKFVKDAEGANEQAEVTPAEVPDKTEPVEAKPEAPKETELFPGYSALPDDVKTSLKAKFDEAEHFKKERDDFQQRWRAQTGQLAPIQRQNEELRRKWQEAQSQPKPSTSQVSDDELKAYQANFPEESKVILGKYQELESKLKEVENWREQEAQRIQQVEQHLFISSELNQLNQHRATWRQDKPLLEKWVDMLDPDEQQDARALMGSLHAKDNIRLWKWFEREEKLAQLYQQLETQEKPVEPTGVRKPPVDPNLRNRQSPATQGGQNAMNPQEQEFLKFWEADEAARAAVRRRR